MLWLSYDTVPPHWDSAGHMLSALKYHEAVSDYLQQHDWWSIRSIKTLLWKLHAVDRVVYPPLFPFMASFVIFLAGSSIKWLAMTNVLFMTILIYSLFQIGKRIQNEETGILACILFVLYPLVFNRSREFMLETALLAVTAFSCYFLLYSEEFRHRAYTTLFGLSVGLGMLVKPTYLSYMFGPVCFVLWSMARDIIQRNAQVAESVKRIIQVVPSLLVGLLIAGLWYIPNYGSFIKDFRRVTSLDTTGYGPLDIQSFLFFPNVLIVQQIGLFFFLIFVYGLSRLTSSIDCRKAMFLVTWVLSIYLIHTLARFKVFSQDVGILLPISIISAIGLSSLGRWRRPAIAATLAMGIFQFATLSLPEGLLANKMGKFEWAGHYAMLPKKEDWRIEEALVALHDHQTKVVVLSDHIFINGTTFEFYTKRRHLPLAITPCWQAVWERKDLSSYDVIVAKSDTDWIPRGAQGDYCFGSPEPYIALLKNIEGGNTNFELFKKYLLPDGTEMLIYQRKTHVDEERPRGHRS